jgi:hypothetical protein
VVLVKSFQSAGVCAVGSKNDSLKSRSWVYGDENKSSIRKVSDAMAKTSKRVANEKLIICDRK